jgi:hypothetical protein
MRKLILTAGVAALAICAPASAKPGGGGGHGGQAQAQQGGDQRAQRGGGGQKAERGGGGGERAIAQRRGGGGDRQITMERRGGGRQAQAFERRGGGGQRFANFQSERGHGGEKAQRAEHRGGGNPRIAVQNEHGRGKAQQFERRGNGQHDVRMVSHGQGNRDFQENRANQRVAMEQKGRGHQRFQTVERGNERFQVENRGGRDRMAFANGDWTDRNREFVERVRGDRFYDPRSYDRIHNTTLFVDRGIPAAYVGGCPPGLAKKSPACVPPGLARSEFVGQALPAVYASNYIPRDLRYLYSDTPDYYYRWGDGYVYRVNRANNLVAGLLPLIGAGYGIGQPFPYMANPYYSVPSYYQSFYPDTPYDYYRYDDGYVYRIDAGTGYIEDVIPLLDRGYGIGQMMPVSYSYYNVPYQYRDVYYDTPDYYYRYAPGAIYQVDRESQLITSIASLLTGGLAVGQPLPAAYSAYNVPMAYRPMYYDTPDSWYRYSDGYIYQVDPTTQLITAIVRAIV